MEKIKFIAAIKIRASTPTPMLLLRVSLVSGFISKIDLAVLDHCCAYNETGSC